MQYNIKITGTGTADQIAGALRVLAAGIQAASRNPNWEGVKAWEDQTIICEILPTKAFLWVDKSGSGRPSMPHTYESLLEINDKEESENINYDGLVLSEWAAEAEVGEEWENASEKYIRVE